MKSSEVGRTLHVQYGKFVVKGTDVQSCFGMIRKESERDPQIIFLSADPTAAPVRRGPHQPNREKQNRQN